MPIKKSELYNSIWAGCDELRGGMDASQYKDYVLTLLFVKYVSDKYAGKEGELEIPNGGGFADLIALRGKKDIGDGINKVIAKLAEANRLKRVIDLADFKDENKLGRGKEMQERLSNLVGIFQDPALDFSKNRVGDDLLGDAYEYLMRPFATQSGKSKGQFYTPAEVSRVTAQVKPQIEKWERITGVCPREWKVKQMKTRWGTCNAEVGRIWLNLELAKKPERCIEYIIAHELVHLHERKHNARFASLMREELNRLPAKHEEWTY